MFEDNVKTITCATCGFEFKEGEEDKHVCTDELRKRLFEAEYRYDVERLTNAYLIEFGMVKDAESNSVKRMVMKMLGEKKRK